MSLFKTLWDKLLRKPHAASELHKDFYEKIQDVSLALSLYQQQAAECDPLTIHRLKNNMAALKALATAPKEELPENRSIKIREHLGPPECGETLRQERWQAEIKCPVCGSHYLKRLPALPPQDIHIHRYSCLSCGHEFSDDGETPLGEGSFSLQTWMHCWYLMGCTDSLAYIAKKLGLDLSIVEIMVLQLKQTFQTETPSLHVLEDEGRNTQSQRLREQLRDDLLRHYERLNAQIATQPKDTGEYRRQEETRRHPTETPTPYIPKKR